MKSSPLFGWRGELSELNWLNPNSTMPLLDDTCDLQQMAAAAWNYLDGNPDPKRAYECKFHLGPLGIPLQLPEIVPPNQYGFDPVSLGDTDVRMLIQYPKIRSLLGITEISEVENGVYCRVINYLGDDWLAHLNPAASTGAPFNGTAISTWTTAKILYVESERFAATNLPIHLERTQKIISALKTLIQWDGDRAWLPGVAPYANGKWILEGWCEQHGRNYPSIIAPLVRCWECTGNEEALALARAFAEGFLAESQPNMGDLRVNPLTGAFNGHVHLHTHAVWGVAHLGRVLNDSRYLDWAEKVFLFVTKIGTDYGWFPEFSPQDYYRTEVCVVGDMVKIAANLALAGRHSYFDAVERIVRNELKQSQFSLNAEFLQLFETLHCSDTPETRHDAISELRKVQGGFVAQSSLTDWVGYPDDIGKAGLYKNGIQMMGCCPPEAMFAICQAHESIIQIDGDIIKFNLGFSIDHLAARLECFHPACGFQRISAKRQGTYQWRLPAASHPESVQINRNGVPETFLWQDGYAQISNVASGDCLEIRFAVATFTQTMTAISNPANPLPLKVQWVGNQVLRATVPEDRHLPMWSQV